MSIKIALVNSPLEAFSDYEGSERSPYPPLGLLALATFVKIKKPDVHIEILDGCVKSMEEIMGAISRTLPDIVGINSFGPTYSNSLIIARSSKKIGAKVILGGHHAASLAREILSLRGPYSNDYCIDAIVQNDGEEAFYKVVMNEPFENIPNVIFSPSPGIVRANKVRTLDFNSLPMADRNLINLNPYFKTQRALNVFSKIGCKWRSLTGSGCIFCSRMHNEERVKSPQNFWQEVNLLREKYKIDMIFDGRDDFLEDDDWLKKVSEMSSDYSDRPALTIFTSPNNITPATIEIMKKIKVSRVILGVESGDQTILKIMRKGTWVENNKKAIKTLLKNGISIFASFTIGAPQETAKSIHNTKKFVNEIKKISGQTGVPLSIKTFFFSPIPGCIAFRWIQERTGAKYSGKDYWDRREFLHDWVNIFCRTSYDEISLAVREMNL
jgi:radical SAM superfamily enzyme YgiQ (UPF0313 family)